MYLLEQVDIYIVREIYLPVLPRGYSPFYFTHWWLSFDLRVIRTVALAFPYYCIHIWLHFWPHTISSYVCYYCICPHMSFLMSLFNNSFISGVVTIICPVPVVHHPSLVLVQFRSFVHRLSFSEYIGGFSKILPVGVKDSTKDSVKAALFAVSSAFWFPLMISVCPFGLSDCLYSALQTLPLAWERPVINLNRFPMFNWSSLGG